MPDILHRVAIKSSPNDTYRALTIREGLAGWWTTDTQGNCNVGGEIQFRFGDRGFGGRLGRCGGWSGFSLRRRGGLGLGRSRSLYGTHRGLA